MDHLIQKSNETPSTPSSPN